MPAPVEQFVAKLRSADRAALGRAMSLVESTRPDHQAAAQELLTALLPHTGNAIRVGVSGVPGVGKSTFIDELGTQLTRAGRRVAVLAVDPSSRLSGGSILGDKTRMERLAVDEAAFIRPSPAGASLGGVAARTREQLLLCEAAGYDVVLVETVGVGQSETTVAEMTDVFLALMLPGAGDELQGIKRGLLELVDVIAVNKADGDNVLRAARAAQELRQAVHYTPARPGGWSVPVVTCSATSGAGVADVWTQVQQRFDALRNDALLEPRRREQALRWMWGLVDDGLRTALHATPTVRDMLPELEAAVRAGHLAAGEAARRILSRFADRRST